MTDPEYSPFPDSELESLARRHDEIARGLPDPSGVRRRFVARAAMLRNAIKCHEALRERCLLAELKVNQLQLKLEAKSAA